MRKPLLHCALAIFLCQLTPLVTMADELTLFVYASPLGIDWSSPARLAQTILLNSLVTDSELRQAYPTGHMNFHLKCTRSSDLPQGAEYETGQLPKGTDVIAQDFFQNDLGAAILVTDYSGQWENKEQIEADLKIRYRRGSVSYVHFKISPKSCARVATYLTEYKLLGLDRIFAGLENEAREAKGSSPSSFATSVLEIAGIVPHEWRAQWMQFRNIPYSLIGGTLTGTKIKPNEILYSPQAQEWNPSVGQSYFIHFWDPALADAWIRKAQREQSSITGMTYKASHRTNAPGLEIDATQVPTPTDDFWQE